MTGPICVVIYCANFTYFKLMFPSKFALTVYKRKHKLTISFLLARKRMQKVSLESWCSTCLSSNMVLHSANIVLFRNSVFMSEIRVTWAARLVIRRGNSYVISHRVTGSSYKVTCSINRVTCSSHRVTCSLHTVT